LQREREDKEAFAGGAEFEDQPRHHGKSRLDKIPRWLDYISRALNENSVSTGLLKATEFCVPGVAVENNTSPALVDRWLYTESTTMLRVSRLGLRSVGTTPARVESFGAE
jgi:hypothetical protein